MVEARKRTIGSASWMYEGPGRERLAREHRRSYDRESLAQCPVFPIAR